MAATKQTTGGFALHAVKKTEGREIVHAELVNARDKR
jgi:hypothetical protein